MSGETAIELLLSLDRAGAGPLRAQLEEQLRAAMRAGLLAPGTALPSTRALARELGVSRGVVVEAYAQLAAEGYLAGRQGAPTRVAEAAFRAAAAAPAGRTRSAAPRFDFRPGAPDVSLFPRTRWLASLRRALRDAPDARLRLRRPARRARAARRAGALPRPGPRRGLRPATRDRHLGHGAGHGAARAHAAARGDRRIAVEDPWSTPGRDQLGRRRPPAGPGARSTPTACASTGSRRPRPRPSW